jgi:hypothetical protein
MGTTPSSKEEEATMATRQLYEGQTQDPLWESQTQGKLHAAPGSMRDRMNREQRPTAAQQQRVLTGFVLGIFSLFAAFFPICGLPIAIVAIIMGISGRRILALRTIATWGLAFSIIGLVLTFVNICIAISIYFSTYIWR